MAEMAHVLDLRNDGFGDKGADGGARSGDQGRRSQPRHHRLRAVDGGLQHLPPQRRSWRDRYPAADLLVISGSGLPAGQAMTRRLLAVLASVLAIAQTA